MSTVAFADVVHQTIYFDRNIPAQQIVLELVDTMWAQRLRDIAQTGNTSKVYMFSEHSRFGHSLGVAYLANHLMERLSTQHPVQVNKYIVAISAAAFLHDIGHVAPGSHSAYKIWYPGKEDQHEQVSLRVIQEDSEIRAILERYGVLSLVSDILNESDALPPWTWEIISGSGWNVDRGNWCIVDSVMAGVSYGRYNIPALIESLVITNDQHLAVRENRLDALMHFAIARHSMYRQVYQHRVLMAADTVAKSVVKRARDLGEKLGFADEQAKDVLRSESIQDLDIRTIFAMRESWWNYHMFHWAEDSDPTLSDLASRLLYRRLFKTVRVRAEDKREKLLDQAIDAAKKAGFDPQYYVHCVETVDTQKGDHSQSMRVLMDDGSIRQLGESEPLWNALADEGKSSLRSWLVMPAEVKVLLKRER